MNSLFPPQFVPGDMTPGTLLMGRAKAFNVVTAYNDSSMNHRSGLYLSNNDGPFLIIANLPAEQPDVTWRPTLVLTGMGQLTWVFDFQLKRIVRQ